MTEIVELDATVEVKRKSEVDKPYVQLSKGAADKLYRHGSVPVRLYMAGLSRLALTGHAHWTEVEQIELERELGVKRGAVSKAVTRLKKDGLLGELSRAGALVYPAGAAGTTVGKRDDDCNVRGARSRSATGQYLPQGATGAVMAPTTGEPEGQVMGQNRDDLCSAPPGPTEAIIALAEPEATDEPEVEPMGDEEWDEITDAILACRNRAGAVALWKKYGDRLRHPDILDEQIDDTEPGTYRDRWNALRDGQTFEPPKPPVDPLVWTPDHTRVKSMVIGTKNKNGLDSLWDRNPVTRQHPDIARLFEEKASEIGYEDN